YSMGRSNDTGNTKVDSLPEVKKSLFGGFYASYSFYKLLTPYDKLSMGINILQDISGRHQGNTINTSLSYSSAFGRKIFVVTGVSTTYANSDYMDSFYSVNTTGAGSSGLSEYHAGAGIKDTGIFLMTNYIFSKSWSTYILAKYTRLLGDAKDSSIVQETGTPNQWFGGIAISYRF
ncbi:MipA/OmpV family protein, partial [Piscirickettsia salmonis]|uniref:MipA/OmpV family protein n=1 Tax=Piscirickettsia salmonis TaxID=1238 RepID=UPI003EBE6F4F